MNDPRIKDFHLTLDYHEGDYIRNGTGVLLFKLMRSGFGLSSTTKEIAKEVIEFLNLALHRCPFEALGGDVCVEEDILAQSCREIIDFLKRHKAAEEANEETCDPLEPKAKLIEITGPRHPKRNGKMREIKFRVFDKEKKEMCPVHRLTWPLPETQELSELMQFTGLLDSKGAEIYERDIVKLSIVPDILGSERLEEYRGIVIFENGCWMIGVHTHYYQELLGREELYLRCVFVGSKTQVIGNIYEHPELVGE